MTGDAFHGGRGIDMGLNKWFLKKNCHLNRKESKSKLQVGHNVHFSILVFFVFWAIFSMIFENWNGSKVQGFDYLRNPLQHLLLRSRDLDKCTECHPGTLGDIWGWKGKNLSSIWQVVAVQKVVDLTKWERKNSNFFYWGNMLTSIKE